MPRFDFQCEKCQHIFEAVIPFGSKKFPKCSKCSGPVQKQIALPLGIHFKGSGFYKTDSVSVKESKKKKNETTESSNTQKPGEAPPKTPPIGSESSSATGGVKDNGQKQKKEV
ncbi:hypothetical protein A2635_01490 [Candidatus Peribacteria bacterium RIFCSPHIGHO2_01_FULL_51_9]|nr:MAG: hypothetical protein A2635_01490 [Candidatus Peribacteria bacterium RIFCSPHIGHO2_01_FULL_51_9]